MSEGFWDEENDGRGESNAMKVLREKAEADGKLIREMSERLERMDRERELDKLSKVAESKGLDPSVVALATKAGFEANEAGLDGFLKEFGDLVAKPKKEEPKVEDGEEQPSANDIESVIAAEEQAELEAMAAASQGNKPAVGLAAVQSTIGQADSSEAVMAALQTLRKKG